MIEYKVRVYSDHTEWCLNGVLHRENGPAIEFSTGSKFWYKEGKRHRVNGPAIEFVDGEKRWYIEDQEYTEEEFNKKIREMNQPSYDGKIVEIEGKRFELKEIK